MSKPRFRCRVIASFARAAPRQRRLDPQANKGKDPEGRNRFRFDARQIFSEKIASMAKSGCQPSAREAGAIARSSHHLGPFAAAK